MMKNKIIIGITGLSSTAILFILIHEFRSFYASVYPSPSFFEMCKELIFLKITLWMISPYVLLILMGITKQIIESAKAVITIFATTCIMTLLHLAIYIDAFYIHPHPKNEGVLWLLPVPQLILAIIGLGIALVFVMIKKNVNKADGGDS